MSFEIFNWPLTFDFGINQLYRMKTTYTVNLFVRKNIFHPASSNFRLTVIKNKCQFDTLKAGYTLTVSLFSQSFMLQFWPQKLSESLVAMPSLQYGSSSQRQKHFISSLSI